MRSVTFMPSWCLTGGFPGRLSDEMVYQYPKGVGFECLETCGDTIERPPLPYRLVVANDHIPTCGRPGSKCMNASGYLSKADLWFFCIISKEKRGVGSYGGWTRKGRADPSISRHATDDALAVHRMAHRGPAQDMRGLRHSGIRAVPTPIFIHGTGVLPMNDRASEALAEASLSGEAQTYDAISKRSGVPLTTLYHRDRGLRSKEEKAQGQQYLTPSEEKALEKYLKLTADLGNPL